MLQDRPRKPQSSLAQPNDELLLPYSFLQQAASLHLFSFVRPNGMYGAAVCYRVEFDLYTVDEFNHMRDQHAKELCSYWEDIFRQEQLDRSNKAENW